MPILHHLVQTTLMQSIRRPVNSCMVDMAQMVFPLRDANSTREAIRTDRRDVVRGMGTI